MIQVNHLRLRFLPDIFLTFIVWMFVYIEIFLDKWANLLQDVVATLLV